jgi:GPH family glycoside/pentoside/hexuronide:cation symporter
LITDCVEYGEWKTGIRGEGVVYSFYTFCRKLSQALAGFIPGLVLTFVGYVPNVEQTARSLSGIRFLMFVYPASLAIVSAIVMYFFYILNEKRTARVFDELKVRHQNSTDRYLK